VNGQLDFFDPRARTTDPATSHEAAHLALRGARVLEHQILVAFATYQELTDDELAAQLPTRHPASVKSARSRLTRAGYLVWTGETRPSNCDRKMNVWRLA
jgi:hypothetical protein